MKGVSIPYLILIKQKKKWVKNLTFHYFSRNLSIHLVLFMQAKVLKLPLMLPPTISCNATDLLTLLFPPSETFSRFSAPYGICDMLVVHVSHEVDFYQTDSVYIHRTLLIQLKESHVNEINQLLLPSK